MLPRKYASTKNKERVRIEDSKLIKKEFQRKKHSLSYLGMPSGEIKDLLAWQHFFNKITAAEINPKQISELMLNVIRNNLQGKLKLLSGDIEEIVIKGKDKFNNKLELPYDVVFLDFFGTVLYKNLKRVEAITSLIHKQKGHSFLFMLTFNLKERRYSTHTIKTVFENIKNSLYDFYVHDNHTKKKIHSIFDKYKSGETHEMYRQKLFVPYFIKEVGEGNGFKVHCYAPIFYLGYNRSPMVHFSFKLTSTLGTPTPAISEQSIVDIVNLNIKEAAKGKVFVRKSQMPKLYI